MLKTQEVVNFVNNKLNEIGTQDDYSFDIHSNIGENSNNGALNGILYVNQASTMPIPDYVENTYNFVVEIIIPSARANHHFEKVQNIVESFVDVYDGKEQVFGNGKGLLNITPGKPENFNVGYNSGENVPLYFSISVLYTEDAETSGDGHWLLNGLEIPYLNDDILLDKEGNVNKIYGKKSAEVFLTGQTKFFKFRFPRRKDELGNMIQQDLLEGDFDKQYTLTYYDGEVYTEEEPYETTVSIFRSGNKNGQRGKVKIFDITFAEVDNGQKTTKYYIALIDNQFDNQAEDTRWFDPVKVGGVITKTAQQVQQEYYEDKIEDGCDWEQIKAPNLNSLDISSQIYPNNNNYELFDLVNKNYAIIKVQKGSYVDGEFVVSETNYFYYSVTNAQIGQNNQVLFDLRLDTLQTYLFNPDLQFSDCYIEKANLNRWKKIGGTGNESGTFRFNGTVNSDLFETEELKGGSKRLVKRQKLEVYPIGSSNLDYNIVKWLNENVICWAYMYLDPYHEFDYYRYQTGGTRTRFRESLTPFTMESSQIENEEEVFTHFNSLFPVICAPILKDSNASIVLRETDGTNTYEYMLTKESLDEFSSSAMTDSQSNSGSFVVAYQCNSYNPLFNIWQDGTATLEGDKLVLNVRSDLTGYRNGFMVLGDGFGYETSFAGIGVNASTMIVEHTYTTLGAIILNKVNISLGTETYSIGKNYVFNKNEIVGVRKDANLNPKLLGKDYFTINVGNENETFEYDAQKLNTNNIEIKTTNILQPGTNSEYIRIDCYKLPADNIYNGEQTDNLFGYVGETEYSLSLSTSAYQEMLANNKNFYQQNKMARENQIQKGIVGGLAGAGVGMAVGGASSGGVGLIGSLIGGIAGIYNGYINYDEQKANEKFSVDNLYNAPSSNQVGSASIVMACSRGALGPYVEEWEILPYEKEIINDFMVKYGFTVNKNGRLKDYCITRHLFNYVKANVGSVYGIPMSNIARTDIRERFGKGVRFWKSDNIDYDYENYEEWLDTDYNSYESWLEAQQ